MKTKRCYVCGENKSTDEFYFDNKEKTRIMSRCKKCVIIRRDKKRKDVLILRIISTQKARVRKVCRNKGFSKTLNFDEFFGIDSNGLKLYLEGLFYDDISWDNYRDKLWEIDHIVPLLEANTFDELIKLSHYTNLQPILIDDHKTKTKKDISKKHDPLF